MPSWRLINELFFKSFISRLLHEPCAATGCLSICTSIPLDVSSVRHKCERSLAPARETTISWAQLPSEYVSRDYAVPCYSVTPDGQMVVQVNTVVAGASSIYHVWRTTGLPCGFTKRFTIGLNRSPLPSYVKLNHIGWQNKTGSMAEKWRELTSTGLAERAAGSVANGTLGRGWVLAIHHMGMHTLLLARVLLDNSPVLFCFIYVFSLDPVTPIKCFSGRAIISTGYSWRSLLVNSKMFISSSLWIIPKGRDGTMLFKANA